jgi:hypothetical protein
MTICTQLFLKHSMFILGFQENISKIITKWANYFSGQLLPKLCYIPPHLTLSLTEVKQGIKHTNMSVSELGTHIIIIND